ncbi:Hypothetical protein HDN1F_02350 [gamma proteobacterium HdN1]|nr:Hypothetical protein HDN1F_02350 [gamma proteobacterium HdN1]
MRAVLMSFRSDCVHACAVFGCLIGFLITMPGISFAAGALPNAQSKGEWRGEFAPEFTAFAHSGVAGQASESLSASLRLEGWYSPDDGRNTFAFVPFVRWDQRDPERSHHDIRELSWVHVSGSREIRAGWRQVFWGVTEGIHLVDIVNQTDAIESVDGEQKLGQPMLSLGIERGDQMLDLFWLVGSRERTFPGREGRLRLPLVVDSDFARWESSKGRDRQDLAFRWQWNPYPLRLGVTGFSGTAREPELQPVLTGKGVVLAPYYPVIQQLGVDVQVTQGDLLWKLEAIQRNGGQRNYHAADAGLEYTQVGVFATQADLGWLLEWLYDSRNRKAATPFQRDLLLGWRVAFNDVASSSLLFYVIFDPDDGEQLWSLEAQRRLAEDWQLALEIRQVAGTAAPQSEAEFLVAPDLTHALRPLAHDNFARVTLSWFF